LFEYVRADRVGEFDFLFGPVLLISVDLRSRVFDLFDTTAPRNIGLDRNKFEFRALILKNHATYDVYVLRVLLDLCNELSDLLIQDLEAVDFHVLIGKEEAIIEEPFVVHYGI
jgi:hypothetical protein